jgi:hypothetical protein
MKHEQCSYGKWNMSNIEMDETWTMFLRKMKHEQDWNEWNMNNVPTRNETWTRLIGFGRLVGFIVFNATFNNISCFIHFNLVHVSFWVSALFVSFILILFKEPSWPCVPTRNETWTRLIGFGRLVGFIVFNATFNNISVISWRSVLLVEENGNLVHVSFWVSALFVSFILILFKEPSWPWSHSSWIYNYLCNRCLSPLMWARYTPLYDTICQ